MAEQAVYGCFLARIEGQVGVLDVARDEPGVLERAPDPLGDRLHRALERRPTRCGHGHEPQTHFLTDVNAVQKQHVKVNVEIERRAETLDRCHRAGRSARPRHTRLPDRVPRDGAIDDAEHLGQHGGPCRKQEPQRKRQRQHPLPHRSSRPYLFDRERGSLSHPPPAAARTKPATLAAEGHELLGVAALAAHAQEAVLEPPALEISLEFFLHVPRQRPRLGCPLISKDRIVFRNEPIEQRRLGAVAPVARRRDESPGLREVAHGCAHGSHPCDEAMSARLGGRPGWGPVRICAKGGVS